MTQPRKNNKSGETGIFLIERAKPWVAQLYVNKVRVMHKSFATFDEAKAARDAVKKEYA
jgi:hypothetical protein